MARRLAGKAEPLQKPAPSTDPEANESWPGAQKSNGSAGGDSATSKQQGNSGTPGTKAEQQAADARAERIAKLQAKLDRAKVKAEAEAMQQQKPTKQQTDNTSGWESTLRRSVPGGAGAQTLPLAAAAISRGTPDSPGAGSLPAAAAQSGLRRRRPADVSLQSGRPKHLRQEQHDIVPNALRCTEAISAASTAEAAQAQQRRGHSHPDELLPTHEPAAAAGSAAPDAGA